MIEVEGPNGEVIEFPDGTPVSTIKQAMNNKFNGPLKDFGIDYDKPVADVRKAIGALPEDQRENATRQWADKYVARENKEGGILQRLGNFGRTIARGTLIGEGLDELTAVTSDAGNVLGLGTPSYDETLAYQRARDRYIDKKYPVASIVGRVAGGLASGGAALKAIQSGNAGARIATLPLAGPIPSSPTLGANYLGRTGGMFAQAAPYAVGYGAAARYLGGEGGADKRAGAAFNPQAIGQDIAAAGLFTGALRGAEALADPITRAVAPTYQRYVAPTVERLTPRERKPASLSAAAAQDGGPVGLPPDVSPEERSALSIIGAQLTRAGVSRDELQKRLADISRNRRLYSGSNAPDAVALADLDPSLQRLAGSVVRQQPEARNIATDFLRTRQTGIADESLAPTMARRGLASRRQFDKPNPKIPTGQFDRIYSSLKRAFNLQDKSFHGHEATGYQTARKISNQQKEISKKNYDAAYEADRASGINWKQRMAPIYADIQLNVVEGLTESYKPRVVGMLKKLQSAKSLKQFDAEKQFADKTIQRLMRSNSKLGGKLNDVKNLVLDAINKMEDIGDVYLTARRAWQGEQEFIEALEAGRKAFKSSELEAFQAYDDLGRMPGGIDADDKRLDNLQKLYRLGMLDAFTAQRPAVGRNAATFFDDPKKAAIVTHVLKPRTKGSKFSAERQGERLGNILADEQRGIETRNVSLGGSPTADKLADDAQFQFMQEIEEIVQTAARSEPLSALVQRQIYRALENLFGFRASTARTIADKLFDARPQVREFTVRQLMQYMGTDRMDLFRRYIAQTNTQISRASALAAGGSEEGYR